MIISLYDLSIGSYLQTVPAVVNTLKKGVAHCEERGINADDWVQKRLVDDMLPLQFQVNSVYWHSLGAARAVLSGHFSPPPKSEVVSYSGLITQLENTVNELQSIESNLINERVGETLIFQLGESQIPFLSEDFIVSFSLPNLHFHATTTYDLLRMEGVALGKRDYLGQLKLKRS